MTLHLPPATTGIGTEGALQTLARAAELRANGRDIAMLCVGQPDIPPPLHIREAAARAATGDGPHGYTHSAGIPPLREALAAFHETEARRPLDPGRFIVTPGAKPIAWLALLMLAEPGAEIIIPDPFFPVYENGIAFTGATAVPLPLSEANGFAVTAEALAERITPQTRLILLNTPSNPAGTIMSESEVRAVAELVAAHPQLYLLADEIYGRIIFAGAEHRGFLPFESLDDQLIYLNGFSKTHAMTGWRVGYGYWPPSLIEYAVRFATNAHSCVNGVAQMAAIAALEGPQDHVTQMTAAFEQRAEKAHAALLALEGVRCTRPQGAFYLFPEVDMAGQTAKETGHALLEEEGLALAHGTAFGARGEGHLRFSVAAKEEEIMDGIARLERYLARIHGR